MSSAKEILERIKAGVYAPCGGGCRGPAILGPPVGAMVNNIGVLFRDGQDPEAEKCLVELLGRPEIQVHFMAFCFLKAGENSLRPESAQAVADFEACPQNSQVVEQALLAVAREQARVASTH